MLKERDTIASEGRNCDEDSMLARRFMTDQFGDLRVQFFDTAAKEEVLVCHL